MPFIGSTFTNGSMTKQTESVENIAQTRMRELESAFKLTLTRRDGDLNNMTILDYLVKVGRDTGVAFGLHKKAMALTKHGIEIVKIQFDEDKVARRVERMKRDVKIKDDHIPYENVGELLIWIKEEIEEAISQLEGNTMCQVPKIIGRGSEEDILDVAKSVKRSLVGTLAQEFAEFVIFSELWYVVFTTRGVSLSHWSDLGITVQDYVRGAVDVPGELEDAYSLYMASEDGDALCQEESVDISQKLSGSVSLLHDFLDEFATFDDSVMRNVPNVQVGIDREDREKIRKMNTPVRLLLKGIAKRAEQLRMHFIQKRDAFRAHSSEATTQVHA